MSDLGSRTWFEVECENITSQETTIGTDPEQSKARGAAGRGESAPLLVYRFHRIMTTTEEDP